jgi:hypothetical protein
MGRQRVQFTVAGALLMVKSTSPIRVRDYRLHSSEIAAIRVGPSGMEVNNAPVMEIQIVPRGAGKKIGLLASRSNDELEWIAAMLRKTMHVGR